MKFPRLSKKILIYLIIILLTVVFIYLGYAFGKKIFPFGSNKYQAIQLITGDVYYGKLQTFPCCKLNEAYFIQTIQEETDSVPQLKPLNSLFFGPENVMYLQKEQILWWADLAENSQVLKAIKGIGD